LNNKLMKVLEYLWYAVIGHGILFGYIYLKGESITNLNSLVVTIPLFMIGIYLSKVCWTKGIESFKDTK